MKIQLSPDEGVFLKFGYIVLNETILFSWLVMLLLIILSIFLTRGLNSSRSTGVKQLFLESLMELLLKQISGVSKNKTELLFPFISTLFLYICFCNLLGVVPGFERPTSSLSTTTALAVLVFFAVPYFGIHEKGILGFLAEYIRPNVFMLPFNVIGEITRTFALSIRLFGNMLSGTVITSILLLIIPLFVPILMNILELLTGFIQAYIFTILSLVYISSGCSDTPELKKEK